MKLPPTQKPRTLQASERQLGAAGSASEAYGSERARFPLLAPPPPPKTQ